MSGTQENKALGNDLGPIGTKALQASARDRGYFDPTTGDPAFDAEWAKFEEFARAQFEDDLARARTKAQEYGSHDLNIMAVSMEALLPRDGKGPIDAQSRNALAMEMAIAFYLMGKVSRLFGAYQKGTTPGPDSWRDGNIYSMMARWVRMNGRWIG